MRFFKSRLFKIVSIVLAILLVAGFGAFTSLLFNPFEGSYPYDVASLIPRDIDVYVSKAKLADDFDPFPVPAFFDEFAETPGGRAVLALPLVRELSTRWQVRERLQELSQALERLPVDVAPLDLFGGEDIALAARFQGDDLALADWAAVGRASWMGKLAVELLRYPGVIDLEASGLTVEPVQVEGVEVGHEISGRGLAVPLFVTRVLDVIVVASSAPWLARAHELDLARGQDSFGLSAKYGDSIASQLQEGDELELFVDLHRGATSLRVPQAWPRADSPYFLPAFLGRIFQLTFAREVVGTADFGQGVTLRVGGPLDSEQMNDVQKRLYRERGFEKAEILKVAGMVPQDVGLFLYGQGNVGDLLRQAQSAAEEALVANLEDRAREVWGYADLQPLIEDLDAGLKGRFGFCARNNDFKDEGEKGPPHDDTPVFAWALILRLEEREKIEAIYRRVQQRQGDFGISGREPGKPGVFENRNPITGATTYEYWSPFVPGTGEIATLQDGATFVISNNYQLLNLMDATGRVENATPPSLADDPAFQTLVNDGLQSNTLALWLAPRAVKDTTRRLARWDAELNVVRAIDWTLERPRLERKVLDESFGGRSREEFAEDELAELDRLTEVEAEAYKADFKGDQTGALEREYVQSLAALEALRAAFVELSLDQKGFEIYARLVLPPAEQ
jgi:hypothetical protein